MNDPKPSVTASLDQTGALLANTAAVAVGNQTQIDAAFQDYADHCETCEKCTVTPKG